MTNPEHPTTAETIAQRIVDRAARMVMDLIDHALPGRGYTGASRKCRRVDFMGEYNGQAENRPVVPVEEANVVTSEPRYGSHHFPVLDLDYVAYLVPSSTRNHFHLYLDQPVEWPKLVAVLDAMADAGLLEPGYVEACKARGHTCVRVPWVGKSDAVKPPEQAEPDDGSGGAF